MGLLALLAVQVPSVTAARSHVQHRRVSKATVTAGHLEGFADPFKGGGMTALEQSTLAEIYAGSKSAFEWGIGSSTMVALHVGVPRLVAVDSAAAWVERVQGELNAAKTSTSNFTLRVASIGRTVKWGIPATDELRAAKWGRYSEQPEELSPGSPFDTYLVDGRFRVACALRAMLHGHAQSLVLVHDFERPQYQALLSVAKEVQRVDNLVVLQKKRSASRASLERMWMSYAFLPTSGGHLDRKYRRLGQRSPPSRWSLDPPPRRVRGQLRPQAAATAVTVRSVASEAPMSSGPSAGAQVVAALRRTVAAGLAAAQSPVAQRNVLLLLGALVLMSLAVQRRLVQRLRCRACVTCAAESDATRPLPLDAEEILFKPVLRLWREPSSRFKDHASPRARSPTRNRRRSTRSRWALDSASADLTPSPTHANSPQLQRQQQLSESSESGDELEVDTDETDMA